MKNVFFGILLMGSVLVSPQSTMAQVSVNIGISLPPPIRFAAPPRMVVLPETYVYVVPDVAEDIFFHDGWWWRPWEGRWYRSREYSSGWHHHRDVPSFYREVPRGWRNDYRERRWREHHWNAQPVQHSEVQRNWQNWKKEKYWEKHHTWNVQGWRKQSNGRKYQEAGPQFKQEDRRRYEDHDNRGRGDKRNHGNHDK